MLEVLDLLRFIRKLIVGKIGVTTSKVVQNLSELPLGIVEVQSPVEPASSILPFPDVVPFIRITFHDLLRIDENLTVGGNNRVRYGAPQLGFLG